MAKAKAKPAVQPEPVEVDEAEVEETEAPVEVKTSSRDPMVIRREPKPESKKDIVYQAGISEEGGSIKALAEEMECTTSNIRQHIAQCHTKLGFGYTIEGDTFYVTGIPTVTWKDQEAIKESEKATKESEKATKKAAKAAADEDSDSEDESDEEEGEETESDEDEGFLEG